MVNWVEMIITLISSAVGWLFADRTLVDCLAVLLGHILARLLGHIAALLAGHCVQERVR